jgi:hypothetical protein
MKSYNEWKEEKLLTEVAIAQAQDVADTLNAMSDAAEQEPWVADLLRRKIKNVFDDLEEESPEALQSIQKILAGRGGPPPEAGAGVLSTSPGGSPSKSAALAMPEP